MGGLIVTIFILLAVIGTPLFAIFGGASIILFDALPNTPVSGAANDVFGEKFANSLLLVTIPLFTFSGYLMAESGTPRRLVRLSGAAIGWMPGGLAMVALITSAIFTAFTGGSGITIVAIGGLLYPALRQANFGEKFSLGMVTTGGSLGLLFVPSVPVVLYGVVAGILIEKLFLAGFLPGILTVLILFGYSLVFGLKNKETRSKFDGKEAAAAMWETKWELLLVLLVPGIMLGILRIHEAAAFTALYVLIIEVFVYRDVGVKDLPRIIRESMTLVGAIMAILVTAIGFTAYLIQAEVPQKMLELMEELVSDPITFLLALNLFLILVGMLMDIFSAIVVVVPLIVPIANHFGIDPYHLGIVFLLNLEIGYLTPPVGLNLFIASFRFDKPVTLLYRAVLPFIGLLLIALVITTYAEPYLYADTPEERAAAPRGLSTALTTLHEGEEIFDFAASSGGDPAPLGDGAEDAPGGNLEDLMEELDEDDGGGGGLEDLLRELEGEGDEGGGGLDAIEQELDGEGGSALDAIEDELGDSPPPAPGDQPAGGALDAIEAELGE